MSAPTASSIPASRLRLLPHGLAWLALPAGLLQAFSLAWPGTGTPSGTLQLLSLAVLAGLLQRAQRPAAGLWVGALFALSWLSGTFWWLFISMHTYGGLPAPLAVLAVLGLAAFLGSYYALAALLYARWQARLASVLQRSVLFAALWTLAELLRGQMFTGFPWGAGGYAQVEGLAPWLAPWLGVYGVGAVVAWAAALLAETVRLVGGRWRAGLGWRPPTVGLALGGLVWAALSAWLAPEWGASSAPLEVRLLQGNIPQDEKFQAGSGVPMALKWYGSELMDNDRALVVAPETALPLLPQQLPVGYWRTLLERYGVAPATGSDPAVPAQAALLGVPLGSEALGYTNSVVGLRPGQASLYQYDKHHLVPFGEFIPPLFHWFVAMMDIPLGDFNAGAIGQPSMDWQGQRLAPNICYEDLFGEELGQRFRQPELAPTILVNFSNIGWFGDSLAIDQHLHISRLRALEFARPMVRATNTGATALIDHQGRVLQQLPPVVRGVLRGTVQGRGLRADQGGWGITPYAWWVSRWGLAPLWGLALLTVLVLARRARQR
ncbi:apolipoprotein N-acyltransferase [Curvibacter sp. HBC28]|uniref:Apolipoprotein N-acyltransferase n=1 Tax=Curvibacter microcysteis TaxID=3026419 RepID=A0ABT5MA84_9BURK|nr:apolipoprotein N-acyltransferase [Curvibacter sp. HBC28]MDD0813491.1 apolipoprotein N-acyltransferase [Curvibacter sp. HBC28]